jgi:hypothetical protein
VYNISYSYTILARKVHYEFPSLFLGRGLEGAKGCDMRATYSNTRVNVISNSNLKISNFPILVTADGLMVSAQVTLLAQLNAILMVTHVPYSGKFSYGANC